MRINIKTYIILCLWAFTFSCFAQTPTDSAALRALQVGYILPPERVYLHFDNTAYFLGETIWFKAFVTSNNDDRPTTLSRVLYVELVAPEGYVALNTAIQPKAEAKRQRNNSIRQFHLASSLIAQNQAINSETLHRFAAQIFNTKIFWPLFFGSRGPKKS